MRNFLIVILAVVMIASLFFACLDASRGIAPGVQLNVPLSLAGERAKVSPLAAYHVTAIAPDGYVDIYQYTGSQRMHWIVWQNPDTAIAFDVWPQGDSLVSDGVCMGIFDSKWWKCVAHVAGLCGERCTNSYPNDPNCYVNCVSAGITGCTIGSAIVHALTWFLPNHDS